MKAERRHELQTNTLDRTIRNLPEYWREHGSKIALAVIAVLLVIVLVRMYFTNRAEKAARVAENLSVARSAISGLRDSVFWSSERMSAADIKKRTDEVRQDVDKTLNEVLNEAPDVAQQAEVSVLRGDLYYALSMFGESPEATTQPAKDLMKEAEKRYNEVIQQAGSIPSTLTARARFGLAAIAENQHNFDAARAHYEAIQKDSTLGQALRDQAQSRINVLTDVQKEHVIGRPRPKEELRSTTGPTTGPATNPFKVSL
jgi:hypothetical protein